MTHDTSTTDENLFARRRRQALGIFGALGALAIAACGGGSSSDTSSSSGGSTTASTDATLSGLSISTGTLSPVFASGTTS